MKTKIKLSHKAPGAKYYDVSEVVNPGTIEEYHRAIGVIIELEYGFEWEHIGTLRRSGSSFPRRNQALRALKIIHTKYKNGLTLKSI